MELWAQQSGVQLCFIRPGRPVENGFIESFNGRLRDECLNVEWFASLADARQKLPLASTLQSATAAQRTRRPDTRSVCRTAPHPGSALRPVSPASGKWNAA